jgi:hypothetical protein
MEPIPDPNCPAAAVARGDVATKAEECATKLGVDCRDKKVAESARLLRHEQGHFDISCLFAKKANMALWLARRSTKRIPDANKILEAVVPKRDQVQFDYDDKTANGCKPAEQGRWEADIAGGLRNITIP